MKKKSALKGKILEIGAILVTILIYWSVFYFIFINACKSKEEAAELSLALPTKWELLENLRYVWEYNGHIFFKAFLNSVLITVLTITILVFVSAMTAFVMQRRGGKLTKFSDKIVLAGLIAPLSIVPTYWMLAKLHLANTIMGLVFVEVAIMFPFSVMLYKSYIASVPKEIDEAAIVDGCGTWQLFFKIMFPLIKPITAAVIILRAVVVYNDFINPMYFLSGSKSATVQLVIYTFQSTFSTNWGYLFAAILLVSLPPVVIFLVLNKQIMEGVTMGAVKG